MKFILILLIIAVDLHEHFRKDADKETITKACQLGFILAVKKTSLLLYVTEEQLLSAAQDTCIEELKGF